MTDTSPIDELLEPLRADYHARRRKVLSRVDPIEQALRHYTQALELEVARELAAAHGLKQPGGAANAKEAARALLNAVQLLPELQAPPVTSEATTSKQSLVTSQAPVQTELDTPWPHLTRAAARASLVIVGGASPLAKSRILPKPLQSLTEWVDTRHQGTHAIGNLERRIREQRVVALILVEGMVQHRHTDPLVSAARMAQVPCAYAGKGGTLAIKTALDEIERALSGARKSELRAYF
jgi:hypothetical protein